MSGVYAGYGRGVEGSCVQKKQKDERKREREERRGVREEQRRPENVF